MTSPVPAVSALLPGPGDWEQVLGGESGAWVFRDPRGGRYAKLESSERSRDLEGERDRCAWLAVQSIRTSRVLDWCTSEAGACLVTEAVPGVPANELDVPGLRRAWSSIVEVVRSLHDLDTASCPFDRGLAPMMTLARATVAEDRVVVGFLPLELQGTPPEQILDQISSELSLRLTQEWADLVVCHGDLCLPNILVDPDTCRVEGLIDVGRLGTADRYGDLALLFANPGTTWPDAATAREAEREFTEIYGTSLDADRQDFYLRLDPLTW